MRPTLRHAAIACVTLLAGPASAAAVVLGPTPYLSFADSPFAGLPFAHFHLEDFEDGVLDTPGASASAGWVVLPPAPLTDSVDADDGAVDGSGTGGHSFFSNNATSTLEITFGAPALGGALPTHVGIAWTDVGLTTGAALGFGNVSFSAFDGNGLALGGIGPFLLGDGVTSGGTAEDRFLGVINAGAISRVVITMPASNDWEVDHLQYGAVARAVPEPGALALVGLALAGAFAGARRRT